MIVKFILLLIAIFGIGFSAGLWVDNKISWGTYESGMNALRDSIRNLDKAREILRCADERLEESKRFREEAVFALSLHNKLHGGDVDG